MRKGILYAMVLLVALATLHTAYAWTNWPSEDCNTWTAINTYEYHITSSGCYVLAYNGENIYIDTADINVVIDLNGQHWNNLIIYQNNRPAIFELYNGSVDALYSYVEASAGVYLHDLNYSGAIYLYNSGYLKADNVSGAYVDYSAYTRNADLNNVRIRNLRISGANTVNISNSSFEGRLFINANNLNVTNSTYEGFPIQTVSDPSQISGDGAYVVLNGSGTLQGSFYIPLFLVPSNDRINVDFNGSHIDMLSAPYIGGLYNAEIFGMGSHIDIHGTVQNVAFINGDDSFYIHSSANLVDTNISTLGAMALEAGYSASNVVFDAWSIDMKSYGSNPNVFVANSFRLEYMYFYVDQGTVVADAMQSYNSDYGHMYLHAYSQDAVYELNVAQIGSPDYPVTLHIWSEANNITWVFNGTTIYGTVVCEGAYASTAKIVFNGVNLDNATIDPSCANIEGLTPPNLYITTSQDYLEIAEGNIVEFNVTVTSYDAPANNIVVRAYADNYYAQFDQTLEQTIAHLDANQSITLTFEFNLPSSPATYKIYAVVDPDNLIAESNEADNDTITNSQRFHVNVFRYIDSCAELTTGSYKLTSPIYNAPDNCFVVNAGEIVTLLAGGGVYGQSMWTTIVWNNGDLLINGMDGTGKIYNSGSIDLYYVTPHDGQGIILWNDGTARIGSNNDILITFQSNGTVYFDGPDSIIREYSPLDFGGDLHVVATGQVYLNSVLTGFVSIPIYADTPITDSNAAYIFVDSNPTFDQSVNEAQVIIVGDGYDANFANKTIHSLVVMGSADRQANVNLDNVNVDTALHIEAQSGMQPITVQVANSTITPSYGAYFVGISGSIAGTTINTPELFLDGSHFNIYLTLSDVNIHANTIYPSGIVDLTFDLTSAPSSFTADSYNGSGIAIHCVGDQPLTIDDWLLHNAIIDPDCLDNIEQTKNLRVAIISSPSETYPAVDNNVVVRIYNDSTYTNIPTDVAVNIDGNEYARQNVTVPAQSYIDVTFTVTFSSVGTHTVTAIADPDNVLQETDETDNTFSTNILVDTKNLRVELLGANLSVHLDDNYFVTARVYNDSQFQDITTDVALLLDSSEIDRRTITIPAGGYVDVTFEEPSPEAIGDYNVTVFVDPDNVIPEMGESDNKIIAELEVTPRQVEVTPLSPPLGAGGPTGISASGTVYIAGTIGEEKDIAIKVAWNYGVPTKATLYYYNENGEIIGPSSVILRTGINTIPLKVRINGYGTIGKVVVYASGQKVETVIEARPLAQLGVPFGSAVIIALIVLAAYLLATRK